MNEIRTAQSMSKVESAFTTCIKSPEVTNYIVSAITAYKNVVASRPYPQTRDYKIAINDLENLSKTFSDYFGSYAVRRIARNNIFTSVAMIPAERMYPYEPVHFGVLLNLNSNHIRVRKLRYIQRSLDTVVPQLCCGVSISLYDEDGANLHLVRNSEALRVERIEVTKFQNGQDYLQFRNSIKALEEQYLNRIALNEVYSPLVDEMTFPFE